MPDNNTLSRRERQIMDILYRLGSATVAEVQRNIPDAPSYSAVRALLRILEDKGHLNTPTTGRVTYMRPSFHGQSLRNRR